MQNTLYRVGGYWYDNGENVNYIECIDIRQITSEWKNCGPSYVPHTRRPASCVMGEWAWVSGGTTDDHEYSVAVHRWKPGRKWEKMANMISGRVGHAMASDGKLIYVLGGFHTNNSMETLDPNYNTWHVLSSLPEVSVNIGAVYLPWGQIVVTGGARPYVPANTIFVYDISNDIWTVSNITLNKAVESAGIALV